LVVVGRPESDIAEDANPDELASLYEFLILNGLRVPPTLDPAMRQAYRAVHRRGLDPLRRIA
jgi:hypothetical protein